MKPIYLILVSIFSIFISSMYCISTFAPAYMQADLYLAVFVSSIVLIVTGFFACDYMVTVSVKPWQKINVK